MVPAGGRKPLYEAILGKPKILVPHPCGKASTSKIAGRREPHHQRKPISTKAGLSPPSAAPSTIAMLSRQVFRSFRAAAPQRAFAAIPARTFAAAASADVKAPIAVFGLDGTYATALVRNASCEESRKTSFGTSNGQSCQLRKVPMLQTSRELATPKKQPPRKWLILASIFSTPRPPRLPPSMPPPRSSPSWAPSSRRTPSWLPSSPPLL